MAHVKTINRPAARPTQQKAPQPAWQAVFATEEKYDKFVASVVARIESGEVQPREPNEEESDC
jgi:hypothetical protein